MLVALFSLSSFAGLTDHVSDGMQSSTTRLSTMQKDRVEHLVSARMFLPTDKQGSAHDIVLTKH